MPIKSINALSSSTNGRKTTSAVVAKGQKQSFPAKFANRSRRIVNSELVSSVLGSVSFDATSYPINPGLSSTFPWLSTQATSWQQYRFRRLRFRYVTRTATSEKGSVILSPEYNPNDPPPTTEAQASNTQDACEDVCWNNIECELSPQAMYPSGPRKLVRSTNIVGDKNLYDSGTLYFCTVEEDSADAIGSFG